MSRELVPLRRSKNLEITLSSQNNDSVWSLESNDLTSNLQLLHDEKYNLENQLKGRLKLRQAASEELETVLKELNASRSQFDVLKNLCEIESEKKNLLETEYERILNELNQEEKKISVCDEEIEKIKENYLIELDKMTKSYRLKNNILSSIKLSQLDNDESFSDQNLAICDQELSVLEEDMGLLKNKLEQLKKVEEKWQKIDENQARYLINLLEKQ